MAAPRKKTTAPPAPKKETKLLYPQWLGGRWHYLALAGILLLTLIVFLPSLDNAFTNWDDPFYVTNNPLLSHPEDVKAIVTEPVATNYHPLTIYSLILDYQMAKGKPPAEQPAVYHRTTLIIHLLNIMLVFYFLMLLSGGRIYMSLVSSLLFAIHPMHVESVVWISERKDVLYAFFFLLSMICYLRYIDRARFIWLLLCFLSFVLSLASKPSAVVLPIMLFALDYFRRRPLTLRTVIEKIPFIILSLCLGVLTYRLQSSVGALTDIYTPSLLYRMLSGFYATLQYFVKLLFPFHLSAVYGYPVFEGTDADPIVFLAPFIVALIVAGILYIGRRRRFVAFGMAFFFISIFLVLQFLSVGASIISDRYTYISYIGLFLIMTWWLDTAPPALGPLLRRVRPLLIFLLGALCLISVPLDFSRTTVWRDSKTLWENAIEEFPGRVAIAYYNLGDYYSFYERNLPKALENYSMAISLDTTRAYHFQLRGNTYFDMQQYPAAIADYDRVLRIDPQHWYAYTSRGAAKYAIGDLQGGLADLDTFMAHVPNGAQALYYRGQIYTKLGQPDKAIADFRAGLDIEPHNDHMYNSMGLAYQQAGSNGQAIIAFDRAIEIAPGTKLYYANRAKSWMALGDSVKGHVDLDKAR